VSASREADRHLIASHGNGSLAANEVAEELRCVALLKPAQPAGEHRVERVLDHREHDVEVNFEERGKRGVTH